MKRLIYSTALFFGLLLSLAAQQQYDIKLQLHKGEQYAYKSTMNLPMKMTMMGQDIDITTIADYYYTTTVVDQKPGAYLLSIEFSRIAGESIGMDVNVKYDTDSDEESEFVDENLRPMLHKPFHVWVDDRYNRIGEIEYPQSNIKMVEAVKQMASNFTMPSFYNLFPMKIGEKKPLTFAPMGASTSPQQISFDGSLTLLAADSETLTIQVEGDIVSTYQNILEMKGRSSNTIIIDRKTGLVRQDKNTSDLHGEGQMQGSDITAKVKGSMLLQML